MPQPSPSWQTISVFGTYRMIDSTPHSGQIRFTVSQRVTSNTDDVIFPSGSVLVAKLDDQGHFQIDVPAVDDPDNSPANWSIKVEERLNAGGGLTYFIQPKMSMAATGLDLRTIALDANNSTPTPALVRGTPGGLAALDADGDVTDAHGNKIAPVVQLVDNGDGTFTAEGPSIKDNGDGTFSLTSDAATISYTKSGMDAKLAQRILAPATPSTDGQLLAYSATLGAYTPVNPSGASELAAATNVTGTPTNVSVAGAGAGTAVDIPGTAISVPPSNGRPVTIHYEANGQQTVAATGTAILSLIETTSGSPVVLASVLAGLPNSAVLPTCFLDTMIGQFPIGAVATARQFKLQINVWTGSGAGTVQIYNAGNNPTVIRAVAG